MDTIIIRDLQNPLHRWLLFLMEDGKSKTLEEIVMIDNLIKEAEEKLERLGADPKTRHLYESREKQLRDELNRLNGAKQETAKEIAKELLLDGMPVDKVAKITKLSSEEVEKLK